MSLDASQLDFAALFPGGYDGLKRTIDSRKAARIILNEPEPEWRNQPSGPDQKLIDQLRRAADSLQNQINQKLNPPISNQRQTYRRAQIAEGMAQEGRRLQLIQAKLYALALAHEAGTISPALAGIRFRNQVEILLNHRSYPAGHWSEDPQAKLSKAGIGTWNYNEARQALEALESLPQEDPAILKIKQLERDLLGYKIPGFFPTPRPVCEKMVEWAGIGPGDVILEPSAGKGNIAEVIREYHPTNPLYVIEWQNQLREILRLKGFEIIGQDFLECDQLFDRIIQNPPFENFQDIQHVRHAFDLLNPGGRLVSIMSPGPFFRRDRQTVEFAEWFGVMGGHAEDLPDGSFKESGTGVAAKIVMIDK